MVQITKTEAKQMIVALGRSGILEKAGEIDPGAKILRTIKPGYVAEVRYSPDSMFEYQLGWDHDTYTTLKNFRDHITSEESKKLLDQILKDMAEIGLDKG